jgi:hypothetical protein
VTDQRQAPRSWSEYLSVWALFFLLPFALTGLAVTQLMALHREAAIRETRASLSRTVQRLLFRASEANYVKSWFSRAQQASTTSASPNSSPLSQAGSRSTRAHPTFALLLGPRENVASWTVLRDLQNFLGQRKPLSEAVHSRLVNILGWGFEPDECARHPETPLAIRWFKQEAWFMWKTAPMGSISSPNSTVRPDSLLSHPEVSPDHRQRVEPAIIGICQPPPLAQRLAEHLRRGTFLTGLRVALFDRPQRTLRQSPGIPAAHLQAAMAAGKNSFSQFLEFPESVGVTETSRDGVSLYLEQPLPYTAHPTMTRNAWYVLTGMLLFMTIWSLSGFQESLATSLARRLEINYRYVFLAPLLAGCILALMVTSSRTEVRNHEWENVLRQALLSFDDDFQLEVQACRRRFDALTQHPDLLHGRFSQFDRTFATSYRRRFLDCLVLFDWNTEMIYARGSHLDDKGLAIAFSLLAKKTIAAALGVPPSRFMDRQFELLQDMLDDGELGGYFNFHQVDELRLFSLGKTKYWTLTHVYPHTSASAPAIITFRRLHQSAISTYLRHYLVRPRPIRLLVRNRETGAWFPDSTPPEEIKVIADMIARNGEATPQHVSYAGTSCFAAGIPGQNLSGHDLIAIAPAQLLAGSETPISHVIMAALVLGICIGFTGIFRLKAGVLHPLATIEQGIQALQSGNNTFRIPERDKDELGTLSAAFNHVLETSHELNAAKIIQERLLPTDMPTIAGFRCGSWYSIGKAIGGDYIDLFETPGHQLIMLAGDIAGRGIDAGLLMAMVKSMVALHFVEQRPEADLLPFLNDILGTVTSRRRSMSMVLAAISPQDAEVRLFFAGNGYPLLWRADTTTADFIGIPRYPLGTASAQPFPSLSLVLQPGDLLFFYTSGFPEALNPRDESFGYSRLCSSLEQAMVQAPNAPISHLRTALQTHAAHRISMDDISCLFLQRVPTPKGSDHD